MPDERDKETFEQLQATNKLLLKMVKTQRESYRNTTKAYIITITCYTLLMISMVIGFIVYESQFDTEYVKETVTQEVSGENSNINNVDGDQYNDNAVHNEGE